jgi:hypothetical protein
MDVALTDELRAIIASGFSSVPCPKCGAIPYVYVKKSGSIDTEGEPVLLHYVKCNTADCNTASPDMGGPFGRQRTIAEWNRRAKAYEASDATA